ncbi:MAG: hypothetical protein M1482_11690, partial [Chloroflexi bacterium]|nr:hypothetical protein [Chloroflexota bacterium]
LLSSRSFGAAALSGWTWDGQAVDVSRFAGESGAFVFAASCEANCSPLRQGAWRKIELLQPTSERGADIGLTASAFVPVENDLASARNAVTWEYGAEAN